MSTETQIATGKVIAADLPADDERPTFTREAIVSIAEEGDGRTLIARMVPYNETARVNGAVSIRTQLHQLPKERLKAA